MLTKHLLFFTLLISFTFPAIGQIGDVISTNRVHKKITSEKNKTSFSTKELAFKITRNTSSEIEKTTAIYKWITANISYDNELRGDVKLQKEFYTSEENVIKKVLERKKALCGGYAFLFKRLCEDVGISAEVVHGFTKDYTGKIQKNKQPSHTWSAVKLNGQWQLIDITWAISYGGKNSPDNYWFLTKPTDFILSHYPEDRKWTLLGNAISFSEFQTHFAK